MCVCVHTYMCVGVGGHALFVSMYVEQTMPGNTDSSRMVSSSLTLLTACCKQLMRKPRTLVCSSLSAWGYLQPYKNTYYNNSKCLELNQHNSGAHLQIVYLASTSSSGNVHTLSSLLPILVFGENSHTSSFNPCFQALLIHFVPCIV